MSLSSSCGVCILALFAVFFFAADGINEISGYQISYESKDITFQTSKRVDVLHLHAILGSKVGNLSSKGDIILLHG